jgi:predicted esterase
LCDCGCVSNASDYSAKRRQSAAISAAAKKHHGQSPTQQLENASLSKLMSNEVPKGSIRHIAPMLSLGTYIVMPPPDYEESERRYPLCVVLHGNGSNELVHGKIADKLGRNGVIYAVVRAPYSSVGVIVSTGQPADSAIPDGVDNSENDPLGTTLRTNYVEWITAVATDVQQNYRIEGGTFFIYGHSQGGQFATLTALLHPDKVSSYFAFASSAVPESFITEERLERLKLEQVKVWLAHGTEDTTVPPDTSLKLAARLTAAGISVKSQLFPGGHSHDEAIIKLSQKWMATWNLTENGGI